MQTQAFLSGHSKENIKRKEDARIQLQFKYWFVSLAHICSFMYSFTLFRNL